MPVIEATYQGVRYSSHGSPSIAADVHSGDAATRQTRAASTWSTRCWPSSVSAARSVVTGLPRARRNGTTNNRASTWSERIQNSTGAYTAIALDVTRAHVRRPAVKQYPAARSDGAAARAVLRHQA